MKENTSMINMGFAGFEKHGHKIRLNLLISME